MTGREGESMHRWYCQSSLLLFIQCINDAGDWFPLLCQCTFKQLPLLRYAAVSLSIAHYADLVHFFFFLQNKKLCIDSKLHLPEGELQLCASDASVGRMGVYLQSLGTALKRWEVDPVLEQFSSNLSEVGLGCICFIPNFFMNLLSSSLPSPPPPSPHPPHFLHHCNALLLFFSLGCVWVEQWYKHGEKVMNVLV